MKDYLTFLYMGFIGVFLYNAFLLGGLMFSTAQEAFILNYTYPVWIVIFATIFLKEKFSIKKLAAILLGFVGVYIVVTRGDFLGFAISNIEGNLFALAGACCYGLFSVLGKKHDYERLSSMMLYHVFGFFFVLIATLVFSEIPSINLYEFTGLVWLGVFPGGLAYTFWFLALKHGDTGKIANVVFLTPFLSLIYAYFLIGENVFPSSLIGLIVIVAGIVIQSIKHRPNLTQRS